MDEYLYNHLMKLIAPKSLIEVEFSIPYDCNLPGVLSPKDIDNHFTKIDKFNFGEDKGLRRIINYFKL